MKKYSFRKNSPYESKDAQSVGEYLESKIKDREVSPTEVLELAQDPKSPLHEFFEWDNKEAAYKYRINQARGLINALYVEIEDGKEVRAYENVYVEEIDAKTFVDTERISEEESLYTQVLQSAVKELRFWKLKYQNYQKYFGVIFSEIEKITDIKELTYVKKTRGRKDSTNSPNRNKRGKNNSRRRQPTSSL